MHSAGQHYAAKHQAARHTTLLYSSSLQSLGLLHHGPSHYAAKHGSAGHMARLSLRAALPASDVTVGSWLPSTGADLYPTIASDEDGQYIYIDGAGECEIALSEIAAPAALVPHALACRVACTSALSLTVQLRQGASKIIATWDHGRPSEVPVTIFSYLTESQIGEVTNRADLRVRFVSS